MKKIQNKNIKLESQIREEASLISNATGHYQESKVFMVQFDDSYAVGSDGVIYQIVQKQDIDPESYKLVYAAEDSDNYYNYAEDQPEFTNEEDIEIFEHCREQAELLSYGEI